MLRIGYSLCFAILAILAVTTPAFAADPMTVAGVYVDATGESAIEAQTTAISDGQLRAANILINRVTLESERRVKGYSGIERETALKMIRGMTIANEKRSGSRYLGEITVAFNPSAVNAFVQSRDMSMISTQASERLVIPMITGKIAGGSHPWGAAWENPAFGHSLTPVKASPSGERLPISSSAAASADIDALRSLGQAMGVRQILIVEASSGGGVTAQIKDIAIDSGKVRDLGRVSGASFDEAASAAMTLLESDWKSAAVSQVENAQSMTLSVLYRNHEDWQRLQSVINGSGQISDARLDALSKDGALMTITYGGDISRMANELSYKGVTFEQSEAYGPVLRLSGRR